MKKLDFIDSHTGGEPTRTIISGFPDLGGGTVAAQRDVFLRDFDDLRRASVMEPRGSDIMVGALLVPPSDPACEFGVIYYNNVGVLNMCGHATIGVVATLAHMGRIKAGTHQIETAVGVVTATYHGDGAVSFENVPCYRIEQDVEFELPGRARVKGDIAWGGNWFFMVENPDIPIELANVEALTAFCVEIRAALESAGITGENGSAIDHIELTSPSPTQGMNGRNFVLCPGKSYDRSPCGTGTSAKIACLQADGKLGPGEPWMQEGIVGSVFEGCFHWVDGEVVPTIKGNAYVTAEGSLLLDPRDPFRHGF